MRSWRHQLCGGRPAVMRVVSQSIRSLIPSREDLRATFSAMVRGTMLGSVPGVLPGGGAALPPFSSYALEKKLARDPSRFGKGAIEGVAGPEAANNAGAQTSFIPLLTLGIPANALMALMIGYFFIKVGVEPAPLLLGLVLGPQLEEYFRRAMLLADGDFTVFLRRPISATLLAIVAVLFLLMAFPAIRRSRKQALAE